MSSQDKQKRATNGKKIPTIKEKGFAKEYAIGETRLNGTQSALKVYNTKSPKVADQIAMDNLAKPRVQTEIAKHLEESNLSMDKVSKIHSRNMNQSKQLGVSQSAVELAYRLHGHLRTNEEKAPIQIAFVMK